MSAAEEMGFTWVHLDRSVAIVIHHLCHVENIYENILKVKNTGAGRKFLQLVLSLATSLKREPLHAKRL